MVVAEAGCFWLRLRYLETRDLYKGCFSGNTTKGAVGKLLSLESQKKALLELDISMLTSCTHCHMFLQSVSLIEYMQLLAKQLLTDEVVSVS